MPLLLLPVLLALLVRYVNKIIENKLISISKPFPIFYSIKIFEEPADII